MEEPEAEGEVAVVEVEFLVKVVKLDKACHRPPCIAEQIFLVLHMEKIVHGHVLGDSLR